MSDVGRISREEIQLHRPQTLLILYSPHVSCVGTMGTCTSQQRSGPTVPWLTWGRLG